MHKLAIITGGSTGLGFCSALRAAQDGFDVIIASRNQEAGESAKARIQNQFPAVEVKFQKLDLSDISSITDFAEGIETKWDLLINNAGAKIQKPYKSTPTGQEWHVGVNHLGHFALTALIWPKGNDEATVTTVTSIVAKKGREDFAQSKADFNERKAYADSKFLNLAFATALAKGISTTNRKSTLAHPGFAKAEPYGNNLIRFGEHIATQSSWNGSAPIWEAAKAANGSYFVPERFELWGKPKKLPSPEISSQRLKEIWQMSEELSGVKFTLPRNFDDE